MRRKSYYLLAGAAAIIVALGCSRSPYEMAPVRGIVKIDGQPMTSGRVMFAPVAQQGATSAGLRAFGQIQPDGSYALGTERDDDGAVVGNHWVTVFRSTGNTGDSSVTPASTTAKSSPAFDRVTVPSGTVEVVSGKDNEINIDLTSQVIARYGQKN